MAILGLGEAKIPSYHVEDEEDDAKKLQESVARTGIFDPEIASGFDRLHAKAKDKKIISMDVKINNSLDASYNEAQYLLEENYGRPVYFITHYPETLKAKNPINWLFYYMDKGSALEKVDYIQSNIYISHKCLYLANIITSPLADIINDHSQFEHVSEEIIDLRSKSIFLKNSLYDKFPSGTAHFEELTGILPPPESNSLETLSLSVPEVKALPESLLTYAVCQSERLKEIPGVHEFSDKFAETVNKISGRLTSSRSGNLSKDVEQRYVHTEFPITCKLDKEAGLKISIRTKGVRSIEIPFMGQDEVELSIVLAGDAFELPSRSLSLVVPYSTDSEEISARITPRKTGTQYLFINFFKGADDIGSIILRTIVEK